MLERLQQIFRSDRINEGTAVFPDINAEALARDLRVEKKGALAGEQELPPSASGTPDGNEMTIIDSVERIRRNGLSNFEDHRSVYAQRLGRAGEARREVFIVADKACGDFQSETKLWRSELVNPQMRVTDASAHLKSFRAANRLERPVYRHSGWPMLLAISFALIVVEAILNSQTFAGVHEMGFLGGGLLAILIAIINVVVSGLAGGFARNINHIAWIRRFLGILIIAAWVGFALSFNLAVAHFRDAMAGTMELEMAARAAVTGLFTDPLGLRSMQSWLLFVFGGVVSLIAFLKAFHAFDPYPGYSRVERSVEQARQEYTDKLETALQSLEERRTEAIVGLEDAQKIVESNVMEAIDALYGSNALTAQLQAFLSQCDLKVQALLVKYRQANIAARKTEPPRHFDEIYFFPQFAPISAPMSSPETYERDRQQILDAIDEAIQIISKEYRQALEAFPPIEELEGQPSGAARKADRATNRPIDHGSADFSDERLPPAEADVMALRESLSVIPRSKAVSR